MALDTLALSVSPVTAGVTNTEGTAVLLEPVSLGLAALDTAAIDEGEALLFIGDGQSNMGLTGDGDVGDYLTTEQRDIGAEMLVRRTQVTGANYVSVPQPFNKADFGISNFGFGAELGFYATIRDYYPNRKILFAIKSHGGNSITEWCSSTACGGSNYTAMLNMVNGAIAKALTLPGVTSVRIAGFIYIQIEADNNTDQLANSYQGKLEQLIESIRDDFDDPTLPIMFIRPHSGGGSRFTTLDNAVLAVDAQSPYNGAIDTIDLPEHTASPAHFDTDSTWQLGVRFGEKFLEIKGLV